MNLLFNIFLKYIKPLLVFAVSTNLVLQVIIGAIKNPTGAVNTFLIKIIDLIHPIFPSTPESLKMSSLIEEIDAVIPVVGKSIIFEVLELILIILGVSLVVKIYKLIPFKAT